LGKLAPRIRPNADKHDQSADVMDDSEDLSDGHCGHKTISRLIGE
jgi:hypothetical protein